MTGARARPRARDCRLPMGDATYDPERGQLRRKGKPVPPDHKDRLGLPEHRVHKANKVRKVHREPSV